MWYKLDILRLAVQLVPPVLRCGILISLLDVLTLPLRQIYGRFTALREAVDRRLDITAAVQYMEKALNDVFFLKDGRIYIVSNVSDGTVYCHYESERKENVYMGTTAETPLLLRYDGEADHKASFTVYVPTFLCTSLDAEEDEYGGVHLRTVMTWIDYYKPAGKTYGIELYDYEETEIQRGRTARVS